MKSEKQIQREIEKYIKQLKTALRRQPQSSRIKMGNPNDKHLRTYIKNIYEIKLLFPETLDIKVSFDRKKVKSFIEKYNKNKNIIIKNAANKLNKAKPFVIR
mgnify:CR=1 FL=1